MGHKKWALISLGLFFFSSIFIRNQNSWIVVSYMVVSILFNKMRQCSLIHVMKDASNGS